MNLETNRSQKPAQRDHGGGLDSACARYGGERADWLDLSTGINPAPYPLPTFAEQDWTALPDRSQQAALLEAARRFWRVPKGAAILAVPGASAAIARLPALAAPARVAIPGPTYNEHAAAFAAQGWTVEDSPDAPGAQARVLVHPNNPNGRIWSVQDINAPLTIIDESFGDVAPDTSLIAQTTRPGVLVLKSFGKFWGLAGLRLGFVIGPPDLIAQLADRTGPWAVSGPALRVGTQALLDQGWADQTRAHLAQDAARLDQMMQTKEARLVGGTDLFRLYDVPDAAAWQDRLARSHILTRIFPYSRSFLRLGLPDANSWGRLERAL